MTVMPSSSDVADKAVSTEDASSGVEVARLEAVLSALVESKLEAMKADARRAASEPASPRPRPRLASSSTLSSSQAQQQQQQRHYQHQHHHHHHHHGHHHHHSQQHKSQRHDKQHRRHGSAPGHAVYDEHQPPPRGRPKQSSRRPDASDDQVFVRAGFDARLEILGLDHDQALSFVSAMVDGTTEPSADTCEYPRLHQSACYVSHAAAQLRSQYDEDEYLAFGYADELYGEPDDETPSGPPSLTGAEVDVAHYRQRAERFHRPRRKRRRRRRHGRDMQRPAAHLVDIEAEELELGVVDSDDLPPRARWTIVATACLLLAMSLLLVGVTLRMAPIIDEMVRKENEELLNSLNRELTNSTGASAPSSAAA